MSQSSFVIGRFDWAKNRGGGGVNQAFRLRTGRTGRAIGNVRGLPQVVFKVVPNGGCKGPLGLAAQLGYVLGKAEHIIDPGKDYDRLDHLPEHFSEAIAKDWADGWDDRVKSGYSMHMVASFPRGTDPEKVAAIMRGTCHDIFDQDRSRFNYIAALHTDNGFPHVHIVVDRKNAEGEWFFFARDGEFTYDRMKDTIVEHAAAHGIEMVNSSKLSRGVVSENENERTRAPAVRGLAGTLIDHGAAPFQNNPKERINYFVTVETPQGEKTLWGKELSLVMEASGAEKGDAIRITHEGKKAVLIQTRDGRTIETHRNQWAVELPERDIAHAAEHEPAPTAREQNVAEWKREQVLAHAAEYRSLSAAFADGFSALSRGFSAAADLLERGLSLTPEIFEKVRSHTMQQARQADALDSPGPIPMADAEREAVMPREDELAADAAKALVVIEEAREKLAEVRETISQLDPSSRPGVEAQYFAAVRDVERLTIGLDRAEYREPAKGTIYADGHREAVAGMDRSQLATVLEGTGIDPDEVAARVAIEARSAALEAHWVAADAERIAKARGYDIESEDGSRQAYRDLAEIYRAVSDRSIVAEHVAAVDDRDLVEEIENRQAMIEEARDLSSRDSLTHEQQMRLTQIVDRVAGKEAVFELRGGNSEPLAEMMPNKADRLNLAERYLEAEQSRGLDRSDAISAIQADREIMQIDKEIEQQATLEREYEREAERRRERDRDEGHEL
ncbi:relaxase/mobilization nuclease domain-containing protein [Paracoccus sp. YIM 132242]|uniref:Relaxase/mobilization nuclease domain-containing protein n=1 Tax=Paracoccus lichenicola TaxID=2665644 RepID=A0A6L6HRL8_9RHOB|nr:relaxase/mobilization nuclease domain-containing protein [Paracoccus lichenicola]MTE01836.1 relaxase/mobilization nuclease domain-containing protein [Paracoccus lichenicola]